VRETVPALSIIVPCHNEQRHIEACLKSILGQEPIAGGFEVIVVDGMSDDGTRKTLKRLAQINPVLRIIDNPHRVTPFARNIGIRNSRASYYIAVLDAHSVYAPHYIRECIKLLEEHPEVCCSGGPIISEGKGIFGRATAAAMSHPVCIGNATHRLPKYEGYAEGACFPVFRKEIFETVGLFDETLVRNQDDEFNFRIFLRGEKVFISPRAKCTYYVRESPRQLFWQYCEYGYWRVMVLRKHRRLASVRHAAPVVFFALMLVLFGLGLFLPGWWRLISVILPAAYLSTLMTTALQVAWRQGLAVALVFPLAIAIIHFAYALGIICGFVEKSSFGVGHVRATERWSRGSRA
jgi:glycosyltransferase involved in cell wall biosynthesis